MYGIFSVLNGHSGQIPKLHNLGQRPFSFWAFYLIFNTIILENHTIPKRERALILEMSCCLHRLLSKNYLSHAPVWIFHFLHSGLLGSNSRP